MRKELFGITKEDATDINSYTLEYYLTESEVEYFGRTYTVYGVEVRKLIPHGENITMESSIVSDISSYRAKTESFINLLADCKVTPVHLEDITLDYINDMQSETPYIQNCSSAAAS